jgi:hypothetical protein
MATRHGRVFDTGQLFGLTPRHKNCCGTGSSYFRPVRHKGRITDDTALKASDLGLGSAAAARSGKAVNFRG